MQCPKCGFEQAEGTLSCMKCGVFFAKLKARGQVRPEAGPSVGPAPTANISTPRLAASPSAHPAPMSDEARCPICGGALQEQTDDNGSVSALAGPLIAYIVATWRARFYCEEHGEIPFGDLSPAARSKLTTKRLAVTGVCGSIFVVLVALLIWLEST